MSKYSIDGSTLTDIADAIRSKTGDTAALTAAAMAEAIASISGGGGLEYESGIWTPEEDMYTPVAIEFSNTHATPPWMYFICNAAPESEMRRLSIIFQEVFSFDLLCGIVRGTYYGQSRAIFSTTDGSFAFGSRYSFNLKTDGTTTADNYATWATSEHIMAWSENPNKTDRVMFYAKDTPYKWIAVWAPEA